MIKIINSLMKLKFYLKKKYIYLISIIFFTQHSLAFNIYKSQCNTNVLQKSTHNNTQHSCTTIHAQSDTVEIYYPKKIQLFGNVNIMYNNNNIITADTITIYYQQHDCKLYKNILHAHGNVHYKNHYFLLQGSSAQFNLINKNIELYHSKYYIYQPHIYGIAQSIIQRKNNRYTIINQGQLTTCVAHNNSWNIQGSKIIYDHYKKHIDIWNAYLSIKKIPIFYSPYLSLNLNKKNILESYIPNIKYNNKYGLVLKIPFPLFFSKYCSGNIAPYYTSKYGMKLHTKIYYSYNPGKGSITTDLMKNNTKKNNYKYNYNYNTSYKIHWKNKSIINKKWHCNIDYILNKNPIFFNNIKIQNTYLFNNNINQKFEFYYNDKHWKTSLNYLGSSINNINYINKNIDNYTYTTFPQLELSFYSNIYQQKKIINFTIFNQITNFLPSNHLSPKTIRIHTEPIINFIINNYWGKLDIETKLKITHYQQNNINYYNTKKYIFYPLDNKVIRIIPQFKIQGSMIFEKKTNLTHKYKHFLESNLQYSYVPYFFQENIGIYDTKIIYLDHKNLFYANTYSGLDRILPMNQITNNITKRCYKKNSELFYVSIGQILNLNQQNIINNKNIGKQISSNILNFILFSGTGHWFINNYWNLHSEIQYYALIKDLSLGNAALEYTNKNNQIFQINYRYINSQYLRKTIITHNNPSIYHQTISQLGIITYYPVKNNWVISYSQYNNIKCNYVINRTIGIQYFTPCWNFGIIFEKKIINWNNLLNKQLYDNKIQLNFNIYSTKSYATKNSKKILKSSIIPYQPNIIIYK